MIFATSIGRRKRSVRSTPSSGAWPFAYYVMHKWLGNFAYRIGIGWDLFVFSGLMAGVAAVITILYHSVRAALLNPVDSLRYE